MNVFIYSPHKVGYKQLADIVRAAGHKVISSWEIPGQEHNPDRMSTQQVGDLAHATLRLTDRADVMVGWHDRTQVKASQQGSAFWAGVAVAEGVPYIAVGSFDDVGLHAPRVIPAQLDSLVSILTQLTRSRTQDKKAEANGQSAAIDSGVEFAADQGGSGEGGSGVEDEGLTPDTGE